MGVDPGRCPLKSVYVGQETQVAPGDQLRWTKNDRAAKRRNCQRFIVERIEPDGTAKITDSEGRSQQINLKGKKYVDYAWISTTYSSQGKTAGQVLALMDSTTTNRESFYVTVSRSRHHLTLYVADKTELERQIQTSRAKENISDYILLHKTVAEPSQTATQSEIGLPASDAPSMSPREKSLCLWQLYSQGLDASNSIALDYDVGQRALKAGCSPKEIALMLTVGSPMVDKIIQCSGREQARHYVNKTVQKVWRHHYHQLSPRRTQFRAQLKIGDD